MHLKNPKAHNILHTRTDTHTDAPSASTYWKLIQLQASSEAQHCCSCFGSQELIGTLNYAFVQQHHLQELFTTTAKGKCSGCPYY